MPGNAFDNIGLIECVAAVAREIASQWGVQCREALFSAVFAIQWISVMAM